MKKSISFLAFVFLAFQMVNAQTDFTVNYGHDTAGNRIHKSPNTSSSNAAVGAEAQQELLAQVISILDQNSLEDQNLENEKSKESSLQISVYPNPATDKITLSREISNDYKNESVILLLDAKGTILDKIVTKDATVSFDIKPLAKGMYYVYYINEDNGKAWRVVKE